MARPCSSHDEGSLGKTLQLHTWSSGRGQTPSTPASGSTAWPSGLPLEPRRHHQRLQPCLTAGFVPSAHAPRSRHSGQPRTLTWALCSPCAWGHLRASQGVHSRTRRWEVTQKRAPVVHGWGRGTGPDRGRAQGWTGAGHRAGQGRGTGQGGAGRGTGWSGPSPSLWRPSLWRPS